MAAGKRPLWTRALGLATVLPWGTVLALTAPPGLSPGSFSVTPSGAARYTVPLQVPPGTGGMAPRLALSYSSHGGNNLLGVGWRLGGISSISRCRATLALDGYRGAINHDNKDRFCIDGQRLLAVSGGYGGDGTEYRTEIDSLFEGRLLWQRPADVQGLDP